LKMDRKAAESLVEKIASDRVNLNVKHYRFWDLLIAKLAENLKGERGLDNREIERIAGLLDKAQKRQRLAKGLSMNGETEEALRAQSQADQRRLVDLFIGAVKENVTDEETRERIRQAILDRIPDEEVDGVGEPEDTVDQ